MFADSEVVIDGLPPYSTEEAEIASHYDGPAGKSYAEIAVRLKRTIDAAPIIAAMTGVDEREILLDAIQPRQLILP